MVGERYRELIDAADTIVDMKKSAHKVLSDVSHMQSQCSSLHKLHQQHSVAAITSDQDQAKLAGRLSFFSLVSQIKLLVTMPEKLWSVLESQDHLCAARLCLMAKHITDSINQLTASGDLRNAVLRKAMKYVKEREKSGREGRRCLTFGSWNVRSLVERSGGVATASVSGRVAEDKKCRRVAAELRRLSVAAAGLQETHWFGDDIYVVDGFTILCSGRPVPGDGAPGNRRGEGVALALNKFATDAWKNGGSVWRAVGPRLVTARLKFALRGGEVAWVTVVSAYAPTYAAPRASKNQFYEQLQEVIAGVPDRDCCILLGDFNARVGSGTADDGWSGVRGMHGFGQLNSSGDELLSFAAINNLWICNTWFPKRDIFKRTWQHPGSLQWHCIDYILMRQDHRRFCRDVRVVRGAECGSDHQLLCIVFEFPHRPVGVARRGASRGRRFNVGKLRSKAVAEHDQSDSCASTLQDVNDVGRRPPRCVTTADKYRAALSTGLRDCWSSDGSVGEKWTHVRNTVVATAADVLGPSERRQADWYDDNSATIQPLLRARNECYAEWLAHGQQRGDTYWASFGAARSQARAAVVNAKEAWILNKAQEATEARFNGAVVWKCVHAIHAACEGLTPCKTSAIKDENGNLCQSTEDQCKRFQRHFTSVLNPESSYNPDIMACVEQRPVVSSLEEPPTMHEISKAISRLRNGTAAGSSRIQPELLKFGGEELNNKLMELFGDVWRDGCVPREWADATLIPIPKKGDLSQCDNWRGIALLDVVGKVLASVLQRRLQVFAEEFLPESQCGFRRGRGCSDMIFTVRQLMEKSIEHQAKGFFVFIDLKKAYDSVPRGCLWQVLGRAGVPEKLINIIRSFHDPMSASVQFNNILSDPFSIGNGLRQGCSMAPVLFNIFMWAVMTQWQHRVRRVDGVGFELRSAYSSDLYRKPRRDDQHHCLTDSQFADDSCLFATTRSGAGAALCCLHEVASGFGLTISATKTQFVVVGPGITLTDRAPLQLGQAEVECVPHFKYLGSVVDSGCRSSRDIAARIAQASRACGALRRSVFSNPHLLMHTKREAESQPSSPAAMWLKVADDSSESEDEESSPEINSESGASVSSDGSDVVSSAAEEEMEDEIAERLHAGCSCDHVDHFSALISYSLSL
ncbi:uncharacterized protein LOC135820293 [Sycon ciliatum]|uniref:uncharacterized protein LOC135820293 n=1 Tax=Sycon ciliatum TaxID=27933 RepID=UPI0031F6D487